MNAISAPVLYTVLVLLVCCERIAELIIARRNRTWALAEGGVEYGAGHYPVVVALQVGLLGGGVAEVWLRRPPMIIALSCCMLALLLAQALRWWCIATLGRQWNTRVIVVPTRGLRRSGPYRWLSHPNYVAVVVEGIALPLVGSAWMTAIAFTVANSAVLAWRVRVENAALSTVR